MTDSPTGDPQRGRSDRLRGRRRLRDHRDRVLLRRYARNRDPRLRAELVERFLPLAHSLAWRYRGSKEPIEDLVQVASEGLVRAIDGYDVERGVAFSTYATPMILGALRHHFRDSTHSVHVTRSVGEHIQQVRTALEQVGESAGTTSVVPALADRTGLSQDEVTEALRADRARRTLSADRPVNSAEHPEGPSLIETIGGDDGGFDAVIASVTAETVALDHRERSVLALRFGRGMTQQRIGKRLGFSQMQVSRVQRSALRKLLGALRGGGTGDAR